MSKDNLPPLIYEARANDCVETINQSRFSSSFQVSAVKLDVAQVRSHKNLLEHIASPWIRTIIDRYIQSRALQSKINPASTNIVNVSIWGPLSNSAELQRVIERVDAIVIGRDGVRAGPSEAQELTSKIVNQGYRNTDQDRYYACLAYRFGRLER